MVCDNLPADITEFEEEYLRSLVVGDQNYAQLPSEILDLICFYLGTASDVLTLTGLSKNLWKLRHNKSSRTQRILRQEIIPKHLVRFCQHQYDQLIEGETDRVKLTGIWLVDSIQDDKVKHNVIRGFNQQIYTGDYTLCPLCGLYCFRDMSKMNGNKQIIYKDVYLNSKKEHYVEGPKIKILKWRLENYHVLTVDPLAAPVEELSKHCRSKKNLNFYFYPFLNFFKTNRAFMINNNNDTTDLWETIRRVEKVRAQNSYRIYEYNYNRVKREWLKEREKEARIAKQEYYELCRGILRVGLMKTTHFTDRIPATIPLGCEETIKLAELLYHQPELLSSILASIPSHQLPTDQVKNSCHKYTFKRGVRKELKKKKCYQRKDIVEVSKEEAIEISKGRTSRRQPEIPLPCLREETDTALAELDIMMPTLEELADQYTKEETSEDEKDEKEETSEEEKEETSEEEN